MAATGGLALATSKVSQYMSAINRITGDIDDIELKLLKIDENDKDYALLNKQMQKLKILMGMMKDFLEFWKDSIKTFLSILKAFNELAQGSR